MMEDNVVEAQDWKSTKEALANFRRLLLCSKCSNLMEEPVCMGMCEHMLCRSCAGPRAGDGCAVCLSPAWVKDIQINRQLSSIIQLFCGLESLLNPTKPDSIGGTQTEGEAAVFKHKKNFKIWFSPRSRKVRCKVEKPSDIPVPSNSGETVAPQLDAPAAQSQNLSVFNFTSSSQDSSSSQRGDLENQKKKKKKKQSSKRNANSSHSQVQRTSTTTREQTRKNDKKKRLEAINQQWGITEAEHASSELEQPCANMSRRSSKRVSFIGPAVTCEELPAKVLKGNAELGPSQNTDDVSEGSSGTPRCQTQVAQGMPGSVGQLKIACTNEPSPNEDALCPSNMTTPDKCSKGVEKKNSILEDTPRRPRTSTSQRRKSLVEISPTVNNPPSLATPRREKSTKLGKQRDAAGLTLTERHSKSPCSPRSSGRPNSGSPAFMKRNYKGETPLHLAAIKGDVEAVKELLDQGADPNQKDNAGWTPLHEACNLGHLTVVEVLATRGALLNTPGYENDSPLHDAVRNGHSAIVKVLLQLGASQNVLNLHGKRPADYAVSPEMLNIFQEASEGIQRANSHTSPSPSASLSVVSESVKGDQTVVLLASKLSQREQHQLAKLEELLEGRMSDTFSASVSHVVVPEGPIPTNSSTLLALLAGCWVVNYSWVEACLQAGRRLPEAEHEAGEGPRRSRINRCSLLPPLFDGCFFFLLGSFKAPDKDELAKLLREGGGQLLSRQPKPDSDVTQTLSAAAYHAVPGSDQALCTQYIIYDPEGSYKPAVVRRGKVWSAPCTWIIDCITAFALLPVPEPQRVG
uniref:BRCA1 associated RING domain 1 n=1 Tax=Oryzias sinensis TaxID=183150 RepID=A0A8C8DMP6_9TELE